MKHQEITALFTSTTASLMGGDSITETHISTLTDSIILLRHVEMFGEGGMRMGRAFRNVTGILAGTPVHSRRMISSACGRSWSPIRRRQIRWTSVVVAVLDKPRASP